MYPASKRGKLGVNYNYPIQGYPLSDPDHSSTFINFILFLFFPFVFALFCQMFVFLAIRHVYPFSDSAIIW